MAKGTSNIKQIKKVAVLGPESTGKTSLAKDLAEKYDTIWIPEFAREYVEKINRPYYYDDVVEIAREQIKREKKAYQEANQFVFFDTELIIIKIWFQEVFNEVPDWLENELSKSNIDLYLLCYPDLKWEFDPVRENPNRRFYLLNNYETELKKINANYFIVKGYGNNRLESAVNFLDKYFNL